MAIQNALNITDTGIVAADGNGVFIGRTISVAASTGLGVANGTGVLGNPTLRGLNSTIDQKGVIEIATDAESQLLADSTRALTPSNMGAVFAVEKQSGFQEWTGAGSYYTINTTDFVLDRPGIGWINSKKVVWAGAQTEAALSAGSTHYIYIDSTGTIGSTTTRSLALFQDNIVLFEVLVDSDTPANVVVVKENHSLMANPLTMETNHDMGLHGFNVTELQAGGVITLHGTVGLQVTGNTEWLDHDLITSVPDSAAAAITMNIMYTSGAGKWIQEAVQATIPTEYNNAGTPTALAANQRAIDCLWVSKDDIESAAPQYFIVMGDVLYTSLAAAETALALSQFTAPTNELFALEMVRMGHVIINATTIDSVHSDKQTIGTGTVNSTGGSANLISVDTTNFDGWLSASDTTVQVALETLDDIGKDGSGAWVLLETQTISSPVATVNFESNLTSAYDYYVFIWNAVIPETDGRPFYGRVGTGGTPTYQSGGTDYAWEGVGNDQNDTQIGIVADNMGSSANEYGTWGQLFLFEPDNTSIYTLMNWTAGYVDNSAVVQALGGGAGSYKATTAVTAFQFFFNDSNVESGLFSLYGVSN